MICQVKIVSNQTSRVIADCEIIEQTQIGPTVFRSRLVEPTIARESKPGQFVNVRVADCYDPLLRRPFSVHAVNPEEGVFSLLYDVVGRGTKLLMDKKVGEKISIIGPLGTSFDVGADHNAKHILVAGGCGAAPIHFLSDYICRMHGCGQVTVLVGAKTGTALLCEVEFVSHGVKVEVATDDGSYGFKGMVTDLLRDHLRSNSQLPAPRVYSCGPMPMMRAVAKVCHDQRIQSCQLSLESAMACGLGVCMGCVVKGCEEHDGDCEDWYYSRVCTEGPVFNAKELVWE
jgi:dihydroorotate dehydrogenase electron transfer subunit